MYIYNIHPCCVHKYVETLDGTIPRVLFTIKYVWYANYDELVPQEYGILVSNLVKKIKNFKRNLVYLSSLYLAQLPRGSVPLNILTIYVHSVR